MKADPSISLSGAERVIDEWAKESGRGQLVRCCLAIAIHSLLFLSLF